MVVACLLSCTIGPAVGMMEMSSDFAGGTAIHLNSGVAALALFGFGKETVGLVRLPTHNMPMV